MPITRSPAHTAATCRRWWWWWWGGAREGGTTLCFQQKNSMTRVFTLYVCRCDSKLITDSSASGLSCVRDVAAAARAPTEAFLLPHPPVCTLSTTLQKSNFCPENWKQVRTLTNYIYIYMYSFLFFFPTPILIQNMNGTQRVLSMHVQVCCKSEMQRTV